MRNPFLHTALYCDYYELTMAQGYLLTGKAHNQASFAYFFRNNPFGGSYTVFAGLSTALSMVQTFSFTDSDIEYLKKQGFKQEFLEYLANFSFTGNISSVKEGEVVFPETPVLRIEGPLIEVQLMETLMLNIINYQSLVATKASRMRLAAGDKLLLEFGLRRAQGWGGIMASKAAILGGFQKTSNVLSAYRYKLETTGTMAHAWVQAFDTELQAFREYARIYGNASVLLVDTYDTFKSGLPNAIKVAHEMQNNNQQLLGIRIDSGNLLDISKKARDVLNDNNLHDVLIVASNKLDEHHIQALLNAGAPIDVFGVGTSLVTGAPDAALDGVYKLVEIDGVPTMKYSGGTSKKSVPGKNNIFRYYDKTGLFKADIIIPENENSHEMEDAFEINTSNKIGLTGLEAENLLQPVMEDGELILEPEDVNNCAKYLIERLNKLPDKYKQINQNHMYPVGISPQIKETQNNIIKNKEIQI